MSLARYAGSTIICRIDPGVHAPGFMPAPAPQAYLHFAETLTLRHSSPSRRLLALGNGDNVCAMILDLHRRSPVLWSVLAVFVFLTFSASAQQASQPSPDLFAGLRWRNIGPFHGGRNPPPT